MTDAMQSFYTHYIRPNVESQPKDEEDSMWTSLFLGSLTEEQLQDLPHFLAFYAVNSFRMGLKMGMALEADLQG